MTPPRQVLPGMTMMITCRAVSREFRFVPTKKVVATLWFVFAYAISQFEVDVHEFCWMSNHYHVVLTTRDDRLPRMIQTLNSLASRALNALRGWSGSNIERAYNITVETSTDAILEHCAYTLANPCASHLVVRAGQWKGLTSIGMSYGETLIVERPTFGLWGRVRQYSMRSRGRAARAGRTRTPNSVSFSLVRPPVWPGRGDAEVRAEILRRVGEREARAEAKRVAAKRCVLGMRRVRQQGWNELPVGRDEMFGPVPKAAGSRRKRRQVEREYARFVEVYRAARERWIGGERDVLFPYGTFLMREQFEVRCATGP